MEDYEWRRRRSGLEMLMECVVFVMAVDEGGWRYRVVSSLGDPRSSDKDADTIELLLKWVGRTVLIHGNR